MSLALSQKTIGNIQVLVLAGEIDAQTLPPLEGKLQELLDKGHYSFVLDFQQVSFIASAGLGVLMSVIGTIQENNGDLVIASAQPEVYRTFDLLDFTTLFKFTDSVAAGVALFPNAAGVQGD
ncbi:MAG: STAS domain-containing protein [Cyanobacteria bacterium NC_groundwater_1444_Ag_S-0.65um_54_12]|nr:STAS domain-containing protein [Cyanobacteria bacterium NC_groundwater_1444_Ag_S-0.65um_54_12]